MLGQEVRPMSPTLILDALWRDARLALRVLRRCPVFTATAVLTLAVGLGANAAIFSMVDALLLRALPYPEPERLALVSTYYRSSGFEGEQSSQDGRTWEILRDGARSVDLAVYSGWPSGANLYAGGSASHVQQQRVGAGFFRVLGVAPALGREIVPEEDVPNGPAVAVLAHGLWRRAFGGDPAILGRTILLKGEPHTVVGVMPEGFRSLGPADLWTPIRPSTSGEGGGTNYGVLARLRPGVTWAEADAEVGALAGAAWSGRVGDTETTARFFLTPLRSGLTGGLRGPLLMIWGAVGLVLAVVAANLASLMLARSGRRSREVAARIALGSGRSAVVRLVLVESLVLALAGGALGLAFGYVALQGLGGLARDALGVWQPLALDGRVAAATVLLALATSFSFGLGPALQASRLDPRSVLSETGGRGASGAASHWPRRLLVVGEVAVGVTLVIFAGLLVRTFTGLRALDPGFEPEGVITGTVSLDDARYRSREAIDALFERSLERIRSLPGVESAAVGLGLPYERPLNLGFQATRPDGTQTEPAAVSATYVTPGYFETLRIPLLEGRVLAESDRSESAPVAVVNRAFVTTYLGGQSPLLARLGIAGQEREIVGVVGNVLQNPAGLGGTDPIGDLPVVYLASAQVGDATFVLVHTWFQPSWIVRSALPAEAVVDGLAGVVREIDPRLPFAAFRDLAEVEASALARERFLMTLLAALAGVAVLLVALGIYGLMASTVAERTRELGIRLALGATVAQALRAVTVPGAVLAGAGIALGIGLALASARLVRHLLWGVSATDPWTFAAAAAALALVAILASLGPGLRVLRLDPARTLREE
jgi:predicted permease